MFLAYCFAVCEDDLICDLAETYHIYRYEDHDPRYIGVLCMGLRDNSRVKMKVGETKITLEQALLGRIADELAFISWSKTKDAQKGRNRPASILKMLTEEKETQGFADEDAFLKAWASIAGEQNA